MGIVNERSGEDIEHESTPLSYEAQIERQFADLGSHFNQPNDPFDMPSAEQVYQNSADQYSNHNQSYGSKPNFYDDYNNTYDSVPRQSMQGTRSNRGPGVLQKNHRKFADAYEYERDGSHHSGSSGAARKVMDFFRRRAKSRAGDER
jgi:protein-serine/threonine kinase